MVLRVVVNCILSRFGHAIVMVERQLQGLSSTQGLLQTTLRKKIKNASPRPDIVGGTPLHVYTWRGKLRAAEQGEAITCY